LARKEVAVSAAIYWGYDSRVLPGPYTPSVYVAAEDKPFQKIKNAWHADICLPDKNSWQRKRIFG
jgi:hypothetical protein